MYVYPPIPTVAGAPFEFAVAICASLGLQARAVATMRRCPLRGVYLRVPWRRRQAAAANAPISSTTRTASTHKSMVPAHV